MSGNAGVFKVNGADESVTVILVKEAVLGDKVKGLDKDLNPAVCEVMALGYWGQGALYGNYTPSHYVYDENSGDIVEHGQVGEYSFDDKYTLLTSCPLVLDETEKAFTPIDSDVSDLFGDGEVGSVIPWDVYVNIFNYQSNLVENVGPCFLDQEGYEDFEGFAEFTKELNEVAKKCLQNGGQDCIEVVNLQEDSMKFYAEPCKLRQLAVLQQWIDLRAAGATDAIQAIVAALAGKSGN